MKQNDRIIQDALLKNNVLAENDLKEHVASIRQSQRPLKDYLIENKIVSEKQLLIALSQTLNLETIELSDFVLDKQLTEKIPIKFVWYYKFLPVSIEGKTLTIAVANPPDVRMEDEIRMHLGFTLKIKLTTDRELAEAIKKNYGLASHTLNQIINKEPIKAKKSDLSTGDWIEDLERESEDPTISNLVNEIILEAYNKRATDIHIEPFRNKIRLRYRVDGVLVDGNLPDDVKHFLPQILSRIKILANLSITEKRLPQDGSAVVKTKDQHIDLRVSTMPTPRGESIVIRLLPTKVMLFSLEKLGFNTQSVEQFRHLIKKPHGIIFITGPTGSGKTTTLYACLKEINSDERKIITIEDPVEYEMEGVTQVQVNPKVNFQFATGLRSILRHDPDIIMVGEVRDLETAEIAIRTALTGHLVFSTLHTNDSASGVTRLIDMGVEPYLVSSSVEAFVAQRLVRLVCEYCKEEIEPPEAIKQEMKESLKDEKLGHFKIYQGKGCEHCNQTGYYGRMAIYEILLMNDHIRKAILEVPRSDYIKSIAMKEGMVTLRQNGWKAVLDGLTTPDEVLNVTVKDKEEEDLEDIKDVEDETSDKIKNASLATVIEDNFDKNSEGQYEARIYPRTYHPIYLKFRPLKRDEANSDKLIYDGPEYETTTKDFSAGGLKFFSQKLITVGTLLELKIKLRKDSEEYVECLGKVARVEEDNMENIFAVVSYYLDISSSERVLINKFVEKTNSSS